MSMSRADYKIIAETIKQIRTYENHFESYEHLFDVLSQSLATTLAITNPRFDEDKFLAACGHTTQTKEK